MITEFELDEAVLQYFVGTQRANELFEKYVNEFPERNWALPHDKWVNNYSTWLLYEKISPETGKTIFEEFALTADLTPELKASVPTMRNVIRGEFIVISKKDNVAMFKISDSAPFSNNLLKVVLNPELSKILRPNVIINGKLQKIGSRYRILGVCRAELSPLILHPKF